MEYPRVCAFCKKPFTGWSSSCLYCSARCRKNAQARRRYNRTKERDLCVWCFRNPVESGYSLCADCREKHRDYRYNMSPEKKAQAYQKTREWIKTQDGYYTAQSRKSNHKLRTEVFDHYGNRCTCCGESDWRFLTVDHVNNNGSEHRRTIRQGSGIGFYRWLRKNQLSRRLSVALL